MCASGTDWGFAHHPVHQTNSFAFQVVMNVLGEIGTVEDAAELVSFLISPAARLITGIHLTYPFAQYHLRLIICSQVNAIMLTEGWSSNDFSQCLLVAVFLCIILCKCHWRADGDNCGLRLIMALKLCSQRL